MFMRNSMVEQEWFQESTDKFNSSLRGFFRQDTSREDLTKYHVTRYWEYPWVLYNCPPQGQILDIGSNLQFPCALIGMGHDVTIHNTAWDLEHFGRIHGWKQDGGIRTHPTFLRYANRAKFVIGYLENLHFLQPESFDTIYCISVLEHIPSGDPLMNCLNGMWKLLRPGGRLCCTVDWLPEYQLEEEGAPSSTNHDLKSYIDKLQWKYNQTFELPPFDNTELLKDTDIFSFRIVGIQVMVYGFIMEKVRN